MLKVSRLRSVFSKQAKLRQSVRQAAPLFAAAPLEPRLLLSVVPTFGTANLPSAGANPLAFGDFHGNGKTAMVVAQASGGGPWQEPDVGHFRGPGRAIDRAGAWQIPRTGVHIGACI